MVWCRGPVNSMLDSKRASMLGREIFRSSGHDVIAGPIQSLHRTVVCLLDS